ncbi:MAG: hypothetical protein KGL39_27305 [Patescibacteria group bacterium]|nr:hypothetical protein [Patescibacteria group bacterium]
MGSYHIHIEGEGCHDNVGLAAGDYDADKLLKKFVGVLVQQGHKIHRAELIITQSQREVDVTREGVLFLKPVWQEPVPPSPVPDPGAKPKRKRAKKTDG